MSKKIAVPFLESIRARQRFSVELQCTLPGCMKAGLEYYAAALSFNQDQIPRSTVQLVFISDLPEWVRVYDVAGSGKPALLRDLQPSNAGQDECQYVDFAENVKGRSTRVYLFRRAEPQAVRDVRENRAMARG